MRDKKEGKTLIEVILRILIVLIVGFVVVSIITSKPEPECVISNSYLSFVYGDGFKLNWKTCFYMPALNKIINKRGNGHCCFLFINEGSSYELRGPYDNLLDTLSPPELKKITANPSHYHILNADYNEGMFIFSGIGFLGFNSNSKTPYFMYCSSSDSILQGYFKDYIIYDENDSISNSYTGGWLLRLEPNWYLVSPDSCDKDIY